MASKYISVMPRMYNNTPFFYVDVLLVFRYWVVDVHGIVSSRRAYTFMTKDVQSHSSVRCGTLLLRSHVTRDVPPV
jgi:hypothetical protein